MNQITVTVEAQSTYDMLSRVDAFTDDKVPINKAAQIAANFIRGTFESQTDPWGTGWLPLKASTLRERQRHGNFSDVPLQETGAMLQSVQAAEDSDGAFVTVWDVYAFPPVHQYGNPTNVAWGRSIAPIPQRAFFPMHDANSVDVPDEWLAAMYLPLEEGLKTAIQ